MNEARTEWYCPDPGCDWKLVETPEPLDLASAPWQSVPWQGSAGDTLAEATYAMADAATARQVEIRETAMAAHIRDDHGADDPVAWATEMVQRVALTHQIDPNWYIVPRVNSAYEPVCALPGGVDDPLP